MGLGDDNEIAANDHKPQILSNEFNSYLPTYK